MKTFYFISTHTLYYKVHIPLINLLLKNGHRVIIKQTKTNYYKYSSEKFSKNPKVNVCINKHALNYVADIIEDKLNDGVKYSFFVFPKKDDVVIGTTKDTIELKKYIGKCNNIFALGYQHFPVVVSYGGALKKEKPYTAQEEIFIKENLFNNVHKFSELLLAPEVKGFTYSAFLNLENIVTKYKRDSENKYALLFHPGGYREVLTNKGDSKEVSYSSQKEFLIKTCLPLLEKGLIPVLKTHPLAAIYHNKQDLDLIQKELVEENKLFEKLIITEESYWPYALNSKVILTFGSSSLFELFSVGLKNVLICNFFGKSRSGKFSQLESLFIESYNDYLIQINTLDSDSINDFTYKVYKAYSQLNPVGSVERAYKLINF